MGMYTAVVIGASSGGLSAISTILKALPRDFPLPIIIAQHLHPDQSEEFILPIDSACLLTVKIADEKEMIKAGYVYFAPPDYHLLLEKDWTFSLTVDPRVRFARPSIDVLFESAADVFASGLIGVILTGANDDGAAGMLRIKQNNGLVIVQDPATAEVGYMPRAVLSLVNNGVILPLGDIGPYLCRLAQSDFAPG